MILPGDTQITALRAQFAPLPADTVYLDHAATAPMPESVIAAMAAHDRHIRAAVNRSQHVLAEQAQAAYEGARARIADILGYGPREVVFTSGATHAINLVALGIEDTLRPGDEIVLSQAEHHSNYLPWLRLARRRKATIRLLPITPDGRLDLAGLPDIVTPRCRILALTHASNVSGAVTDVVPAIAAARAVGALVLLDGAQAVPHLLVRPGDWKADFYVFSGHKCFGPTGVGVLCGRKAALERLEPVVIGGGTAWDVIEGQPQWRELPHRLEAGTPPVTQAIGLAAALEWLNALDRAPLAERETHLAAHALAMLSDIPGLRLLGPSSLNLRLPLFSFTMDDCHPHDVLHLLSQRGLCLRGGNLCAAPMVQAMGAEHCLRASLCFLNGSHDLAALAAGLHHARKVLS